MGDEKTLIYKKDYKNKNKIKIKSIKKKNVIKNQNKKHSYEKQKKNLIKLGRKLPHNGSKNKKLKNTRPYFVIFYFPRRCGQCDNYFTRG